MSFIWPWLLLSLLLIPLLIVLYLRLLQKRRQAVLHLGQMGLMQNRARQGPGFRRHVPPLFFVSGLTVLLFALARPEMAVSLPRIEGTVILAFDISSSMTADDLEPSRIEAAKTAVRAFVENQPSTIQIGVVAFSNGGLVVQPPTNVQGDILGTIERLEPQGGTSLGQGIFTSLNAIAGEPIAVDPEDLEAGDLGKAVADLKLDAFSSAVVILLTDGENTENPDPLEIAQLAAEAGVRIYPVGVGNTQGSVVEIDGFNIVTQLDEPMLEQIAGLTNGTYFRAEDETALQEIYENIDLQLTIRGEETEVTAILAGIGFVLLTLGGGFSMLWFGRMP